MRHNIPVNLKVLIRTSSGCGLWRGFITLKYYLLMVDFVYFLPVAPLPSSTLWDNKENLPCHFILAEINGIGNAVV